MAAGLVNTLRQVGTATGVAVLGALYASRITTATLHALAGLTARPAPPTGWPPPLPPGPAPGLPPWCRPPPAARSSTLPPQNERPDVPGSPRGTRMSHRGAVGP